MNTIIVSRNVVTGLVIVRVVSSDRASTRNLNDAEMEALAAVLNEVEFEQHVDQAEFQNQAI